VSEPRSGASGRGALAELKEAVTQLFEQVAGFVPDVSLKPDFPRHELRTEDDMYKLVVELPGMRREDIEVSVTGRAVNVSGTRPRFETPPGGRTLRAERPAGRFDLNVNLAAEVDTLGVTARMRDGLLEVRLPRLTATRGRSIDVEADEPGGGSQSGSGQASSGPPEA
jgi:HSP20 family protein